MSVSLRSRRLLQVAFVLLVVAGLVVAGGLAARFWLPGYLVRTVLQMAGATGIHYEVVRGTPWRLEVDALSFRIGTQAFSTRRVLLDRPQWWTASLGAVRVEGAEMPVFLDGSDIDPVNWSAEGDAPALEEAVNLPFTTLDLDGRIIVRMVALPDMPVEVRLEGRPKGGASWIGSLVAEGPGFRLAGTGSLLRAGQELEFQVHSSELDLAVWSRQVQRMVSLPGAPWRLAGKITAVAEGNVTAKRFASTARVSLRGGGMKVVARDIEVHDAEADLEFSDLWKYRTRAGTLRLGELRVGRLAVHDVNADIGLWGPQTVQVNAARGNLLGGTAAVAPFKFPLSQRELVLKVDATGLDAAQILSLAPGVPTQLGGRFDVDTPLRLQPTGVRFEPGVVTLTHGATGSMQVNAAALLRSGATFDEATARVLKEAEDKPIRLRLDDFQLAVRSPGLPLGCSAQVSFRGESEDGPVAATLNINGAIERYLAVMP